MAYTSIWRVRGWLGKSLIYIEDPEKTNNPQFYNSGTADRSRENLNDVIAYAVNQSKTSRLNEDTDLLHQFVSGINCCPTTARTEMMAVKKKYGKEDGTIAYHGIQSFAPNEASPQLVHEIGLKLAQRLWGEEYQVVVATHLDKEHHLHNHFIVNTVSFKGGRKYHRTKDDYREMRRVSDELCREYGLSVIDHGVPKKGMHYGDYRAAQQGKLYWKQILRDDLDEIIQQSMTERQFFDHLQKRGYTVKFIRGGEDISIRPPGKDRFMRPARQLGEKYTLEGIRQRILKQEQAKRLRELQLQFQPERICDESIREELELTDEQTEALENAFARRRSAGSGNPRSGRHTAHSRGPMPNFQRGPVYGKADLPLGGNPAGPLSSDSGQKEDGEVLGMAEMRSAGAKAVAGTHASPERPREILEKPSELHGDPRGDAAVRSDDVSQEFARPGERWSANAEKKPRSQGREEERRRGDGYDPQREEPGGYWRMRNTRSEIIESILTEEQLMKWNEMKGEPFQRQNSEPFQRQEVERRPVSS